jgi:hypothetical protein
MLVLFLATAAACALVPTAADRAAALREPVWNVEPLDPTEWVADRPANPAAWDARYARRLIRFRGVVESAVPDNDVLRKRSSWSVLIRSERNAASLPILLCSVATREQAAALPAGMIVLVHGVARELVAGVSFTLHSCVVEATGSSIPATVKPGRATASAEYRDEIALTSSQLDAQLAGDDEATKKRLIEHPLLVTGRVRAFPIDGGVEFERAFPLRAITCDDLPRGALALGQTVTVRGRVSNSSFAGHTLSGCTLLQ